MISSNTSAGRGYYLARKGGRVVVTALLPGKSLSLLLLSLLVVGSNPIMKKKIRGENKGKTRPTAAKTRYTESLWRGVLPTTLLPFDREGTL